MVYVLTIKSIPANGFPVKPDENWFPIFFRLRRAACSACSFILHHPVDPVNPVEHL
jgi:hypothetical protein